MIKASMNPAARAKRTLCLCAFVPLCLLGSASPGLAAEGTGGDAQPAWAKAVPVREWHELKGSLSSPPVLNYRRMYYNARTDAMLFLPSSKSNWYAVRL